jgi:hypothetical protein
MNGKSAKFKAQQAQKRKREWVRPGERERKCEDQKKVRALL